MRRTGGVARAAVILVVLMVMSGCASSSSESSADLKNSTATTAPYVDLFATTAPELAAVVPMTELPKPTTTEPPSTTTTSHPNRSHAGGGVPASSSHLGLGSSGLLWIGTWSGDADDLSDVSFVLAPDGSVLRIGDRSIFAGAESYLTWNIGVAGYEAVLASIAELGLETDRLGLSTHGQYGDIRTNGSFGVHIEHLNARAGDLTATQVQVRKNFRQLMAQLEDPSWFDGISIVTQRAPWVPDQLAVNVRSEYNPVYYSTEPFAWPLDASTGEMALNDGDDRWVCLGGADAETAWNTFMIRGVNSARLPIEEGGELFEAGVRVSHPMYSGISPCPAASGFGTGSSDRVDRRDVSERMLSADDVNIDGGWTVTSPVITPPPPNIEHCFPITDAEVAVDAFDSWLTHRVDLDLMGLMSQFQLLGEVPEGVDAVGVIEDVGTMSCLDGLSQFGVTHIESGMLENPPEGVAAAAYWQLRSMAAPRS